MNQYVVQLSQEHDTLPQAEVEAVLSAENIDYTVEKRDGPLLILAAERFPEPVIKRLAFSYTVSQVLEQCEPGAILDQGFSAVEWRVTDSFAVEVERVSSEKTVDTGKIEEHVGAIIEKTSGAAVDLEEPNTVFPVYITRDTAYICREIGKVDRAQYEERTNEERPFAKPVSLHPRLARALVNVTQVPRDGNVLDPFCGTGGMLLEAGLMGCDVYGSDMDVEMVDGTRKNLDAYGVEGEIKECNINELRTCFDQAFDAVVTDLPYGTASQKHGQDILDAFLTQAHNLCTGSIVWMSNKPTLTYQGETLEPLAEWYVHKNLTRYIYRQQQD